jgi:two-component system, OmpR family, response regulator
MKNKILVVEDDPNILEALKYNLGKEGYETITAVDGVQALEAARVSKPDLIIMDIMLPKMSGFEVCRILRKEMPVPIIMLTARDDEIDKVTGLDLGADDYMTKPFSMRELMARIRAMLRRVEIQTVTPETPVKFGDLEIDILHHVITRAGITLNLSPKEFDLLVFLTTNKGLVFSRDQLLEKVWGYEYSGDTRTVDVHIRWLREKIEDNPEEPKHLITIRGVGYKFEG